jgi:DNA-binding Lrp family transcriptional regulator
MKIQHRDKEILSGVLKYGLLSTEQIGEIFFKNLHHTTLMRRLRILEEAKLITRIDALPNNQSAWSLAADGAKVLDVEPVGRFTNRNTTLHDVTAAAVRIALERVGLCQNFSSEMEMKKRITWRIGDREKESLMVPDGVFTARVKGRESHAVIAMEVELHPKNHARYSRIVSQYLAKDSVSCVWYFVKTQGIADTIFAQWNKSHRTSSSPVFLFSKVEDATSDAKTLQVYSAATKKWMKLTDIFDLPHLEQKDIHSLDHCIGRKSESGLGSHVS